MIKLVRLTDMNVKALEELLTEEQAARVRLGATTATFRMELAEAITLVTELKQRAAREHGTQFHPYRSLFAVERKLAALQKEAVADAAARGPRRGGSGVDIVTGDAEDRHQVIDPNVSYMDSTRMEISCTWADNEGITNVFRGVHYCPFCGWVIDPKEQLTTNTTTSSEPVAARQDVVGIAADTNTSVGEVANVVQQMIAVLGYDAVVATTDPGLYNHELTETAAGRVREIMLDTSCRRVALMDGDVRTFEPAPESDDVFRMYVLDVLGFSVVVRRRRNEDGVIESVVDVSEDPGGVLTVNVRGIENTYT